MQRFYLVLDLVDDLELIEEYEHYHAKGKAWPNSEAAAAQTIQSFNEYCK